MPYRYMYDCCCSPSPSPSPSSEESPSEESPSPLSSITCAACPAGAPQCWELVIAGVTLFHNSAGGHCPEGDDEMNGVFVLAHLTQCSWETAERALFCRGPFPPGTLVECQDAGLGVTARPRYSMSIAKNPTTGVVSGTLLARNCQDPSGSYASYSKASGFDCFGPNTLTRITGGANFPATVTVEPVAC